MKFLFSKAIFYRTDCRRELACSRLSGYHSDLDREGYITTAKRNNGYPLAASSTRYLMQAHQYYINSVGDIVINANRYAKEADRAVTQEEFLSFAENNEFQLVLAGDPYVTTEAVYVTLDEDGTISGSVTGTWSMYGDKYIKLEIDGYDLYYGVVAVSWLDNKDCVGTTVTAMGQTTGCPLYMNSETNP